jgi:DNA-binding transcriptional ArsR family regulator
MSFTKNLTDLELNVLRALWLSKGMSRGSLERGLGFSRPTIGKALRSLAEAGLVDSRSKESPQRGRPAEIFEPKADAWFSLGMDFELPEVNLVLTNVWGDAVCEKHLVMAEHLGDPRAVLDRLAESVTAWLAEVPWALERLGTVGIGLPGFLSDGGVSFIGRNLPAWRRVRVGEHLERAFSVPVHLGHDVHFMALAEIAHREWEDFVVLFVALRPGMGGDIRIGACLCVSGKPYCGGRGNGGSLYRAVVESEELLGLSDEAKVEVVAERIVASLVHVIPMADPDWTVLHAEEISHLAPCLIIRCQEALRESFNEEYIGVADVVPAVIRGASGAQQAAVAATGELLLRSRS